MVLYLQSESCPGFCFMCVLLAALPLQPHGRQIPLVLLLFLVFLSLTLSLFLPNWDGESHLTHFCPAIRWIRSLLTNQMENNLYPTLIQEMFQIAWQCQHLDCNQISGHSNQHLNTQCTKPTPNRIIVSFSDSNLYWPFLPLVQKWELSLAH